MAAVAHAVAFRAALARIGFNDPTQLALNQNGFETLADLLTVHESDLDKLPKHLDAWRDGNAAPQDQVRIPFVSLKKLKAMRYWALSERFIGFYQRCAGGDPPQDAGGRRLRGCYEGD